MVRVVVMKGYGWENQMTIPYTYDYPDPNKEQEILVIGDHAYLPDTINTYKRAVIWTDTPLVDCNFPHSENTIFVPASNYVKMILENCNVKNITEIVHRPLLARKMNVERKYDMVTVLTQPQRKGHDKLLRVLKRLDKETERPLTLLLRVHPLIEYYFLQFKNIQVIKLPEERNYRKHLMNIAEARIMLFPSQDEGVGYPPLEASVLQQQLVMGDIDATREFVTGKFARVMDGRLERLMFSNHWFLLQEWDEDEFYEILVKALQDKNFNIPKLRYDDILHPDELFNRVFEWFSKK